MNKIVSNFYLIRLNGNPVYVGYTNRPVKTRFSEHKHDKDFGDIEPTLERLGRLEYDFTWDEEIINQYAKEVSNRETELVEEYGTQDSVWQKGVNGNLGGQTWNNVKHFVKTNRDNPKFRNMSEVVIIEYLKTNIVMYRYLKDFVKRMDEPVSIYMQHFVSSMDDRVSIYIKNFVNHIDNPTSTYLRGFISGMDDPVAIYMKSFVSRMDDRVSRYIKDFVHDMNNLVVTYIKNIVSHMDDPVAIYMKNFVNHMNEPINIYMQSFVNNMSNHINNTIKKEGINND